jgi:hypothetical protein
MRIDVRVHLAGGVMLRRVIVEVRVDVRRRERRSDERHRQPGREHPATHGAILREARPPVNGKLALPPRCAVRPI